jgi:hypothetical protein
MQRAALLAASLAALPVIVAGCSMSPPAASSNAASNTGQAAAPPPTYGANAAPAPAAQRDYADSLPYPKQSLIDAFHDSTDPQNPSMPHPPSSYTPAGQPYSPGQQANGAPPPGASAPPAPANPTDALPYPKQSLFDALSNNK